MSSEFKTGQHSIVERSFNFAVRIVQLCRFLEKQDRVSRTLANQLLRSGTSVGANIEEAQAGKSVSVDIRAFYCWERVSV